MKIVIVHGWRTSPSGEWYPLAESLLRAQGHDVTVPELPLPFTPNINHWVSAIDQAVGDRPKEAFIIGHSLGAFATLRYLERLARQESSVAGTLLVASPFATLLGRVPNWLFRKPNLAKAKLAAGRTTVIHDSDDKIVRVNNSRLIAHGLGAECLLDQSVGHFIAQDGFDSEPLVEQCIVQRFLNLELASA